MRTYVHVSALARPSLQSMDGKEKKYAVATLSATESDVTVTAAVVLLAAVIFDYHARGTEG